MIQAIRKPVQSDFEQFQDLLLKMKEQDNPLLHNVLDYLFKRTGKQLRPLLVLLSAKCCKPNVEALPQDAILSALSIELLHTASLQHDDVVDESDTRHGQASTNTAWGNKVAVLTGDFLLSRSINAISQTQNIRIIQAIAEVGTSLASGEILQLYNTSRKQYDEDIYYRIIEHKTANLFAVSARMGALAVKASEEDIQLMEDVGRDLGICFQIQDDILDCTSDSDTLGKPVGNDVQEHKMTMPLAKGIDYAQQQMREHQAHASMLLSKLPDSEARQALNQLLDYAVTRSL